MAPIIKLLKPDWNEVALYCSIGFTLLVFSNYRKFWDYISGGYDVGTLVNRDNIASDFQTWLIGVEANIDPRIADFTAWLIIGFITVIAISFLQKFINIGGEDLSSVEALRKTKYARKTTENIVAKWALRAMGAVLLFWWFRMFFGYSFVVLTDLFYKAGVNLLDPFSIIVMVYSIFLTGVAFYFFAICIRLIMLKIRVFS